MYNAFDPIGFVTPPCAAFIYPGEPKKAPVQPDDKLAGKTSTSDSRRCCSRIE